MAPDLYIDELKAKKDMILEGDLLLVTITAFNKGS